MSIDNAVNTTLSDGSTLLCVKPTQVSVDFALEQRKPRWYDPLMDEIDPDSRKKALITIRPYLRAARNRADLTQDEIAAIIRVSQWTVGRIETPGESAADGLILKIIKLLETQLWQIAIDEQSDNLKNALQSLGLQQKSDNATTTRAAGDGSAELVPRYQTWLPREGTSMAVSAAPQGHEIRPDISASDALYALPVVGDSMRPRYKSGEMLYVDPAVRPEIGKDCVVYNRDRSRAELGELTHMTAKLWRIVQRSETVHQATLDLPVTEWPTCEKIVWHDPR